MGGKLGNLSAAMALVVVEVAACGSPAAPEPVAPAVAGAEDAGTSAASVARTAAIVDDASVPSPPGEDTIATDAATADAAPLEEASRDPLASSIPQWEPCPAPGSGDPLEGALTVAQAESIPDYRTVSMVGYVIDLEQSCPPCPPGATCEPCRPPYLYLGDLPFGVEGAGGWAWVDRDSVGGRREVNPQPPPVAVGQRVVFCGHWEPDWLPGTSRTFRAEEQTILPAVPGDAAVRRAP
jgi:hypothetical protein